MSLFPDRSEHLLCCPENNPLSRRCSWNGHCEKRGCPGHKCALHSGAVLGDSSASLQGPRALQDLLLKSRKPWEEQREGFQPSLSRASLGGHCPFSQTLQPFPGPKGPALVWDCTNPKSRVLSPSSSVCKCLGSSAHQSHSRRLLLALITIISVIFLFSSFAAHSSLSNLAETFHENLDFGNILVLTPNEQEREDDQ